MKVLGEQQIAPLTDKAFLHVGILTEQFLEFVCGPVFSPIASTNVHTERVMRLQGYVLFYVHKLGGRLEVCCVVLFESFYRVLQYLSEVQMVVVKYLVEYVFVVVGY